MVSQTHLSVSCPERIKRQEKRVANKRKRQVDAVKGYAESGFRLAMEYPLVIRANASINAMLYASINTIGAWMACNGSTTRTHEGDKEKGDQ